MAKARKLNGNGRVYINRDNPPAPDPFEDGGIGIVWRGDSAELAAPFITELGAVAGILDTLRQMTTERPPESGSLGEKQATLLGVAADICLAVIRMWATSESSGIKNDDDLVPYQAASAELIRARLEPLGGRVTQSFAEFERFRAELNAEPD